MASNIEKLGETLQGRMRSVKQSGSSTLLELAEIGSGGALLPDVSPGPIPAGEYSICRAVSGKVTADFRYEKLKAGDRVLLCWCGREPVVIDVIAKEGGE
ncbi:hypothetical protein [Emergencia sp. 1XD21-10]|uniref:hypothetical protein n=1 Tax=Emergencia sp. 1XD21-10 TaxID=2304569 RepID=UPI001379D63E|nr:hypothetical protein [Emergencia sp. 1XD21-10]MCI9641057.1 hypothetical protein [Emergencia sp.]NCE99991.1 hypothetical protein [Emergencia sp. 1XD21-10]